MYHCTDALCTLAVIRGSSPQTVDKANKDFIRCRLNNTFERTLLLIFNLKSERYQVFITASFQVNYPRVNILILRSTIT